MTSETSYFRTILGKLFSWLKNPSGRQLPSIGFGNENGTNSKNGGLQGDFDTREVVQCLQEDFAASERQETEERLEGEIFDRKPGSHSASDIDAEANEHVSKREVSIGEKGDSKEEARCLTVVSVPEGSDDYRVVKWCRNLGNKLFRYFNRNSEIRKEKEKQRSVHKTMSVDKINKRNLGKFIIECVGHEGTENSEEESILRRQIQTGISQIDNYSEDIWTNAKVTIIGMDGLEYDILAGEGKHRFLIFLNGSDTITLKTLA